MLSSRSSSGMSPILPVLLCGGINLQAKVPHLLAPGRIVLMALRPLDNLGDRCVGWKAAGFRPHLPDAFVTLGAVKHSYDASAHSRSSCVARADGHCSPSDNT